MNSGLSGQMPVSITLGLWMTLLSYGISIPLGIAKAVRDGSRFDVWTSSVIIVASRSGSRRTSSLAM